MALSNLNKEVTTNLFKMLSLNDNNELDLIKGNYSTYSKLELIAEQIDNLKLKAQNIIQQNSLNHYLHNIKSDSKKIPGRIYYHYKIENKDVLSIIEPEEWHYKDNCCGKYLYNFDCIFYKVN